MTDNEKRAHDLAIAYMPFLMQRDIRDISYAAAEENAEVGVGFYELYLYAYKEFLTDLQGDFPDTP